jgi:hypothetical protein
MTFKNTICALIGFSPLILAGVGLIPEISRAAKLREYQASPVYQAELAERKGLKHATERRLTVFADSTAGFRAVESVGELSSQA